MTSTATVARRELLGLRRDRLFTVLIVFLAVVTVVSVVVGAAAFRTQVDAYHLYVQQLHDSGSAVKPAAPKLFPLQLLQGSVEYLEILGALFAIVLGYGAVANDKYRGTLPLMLSRPLGRFAIPLGKVIGLAGVWLAVVALLAVLWTITLIVVGTATLTPDNFVSILVVAVAAWLYLTFWSAIALALTALSKRLSFGLILAVVVWLTIVLIVPQIGDTMDPDNQVPGGLFKMLAIPLSDQQAVIVHFRGFEELRNFLETASPTKHFERLSFAFLGIDDLFNGKPLSYIWPRIYGYAIAIVLSTAAAIGFAALASTRRNLLRKES